MDIRFNPQGCAHVPVYYWPWVWWQLFWLRGWAEAVGREVLYEVLANGRVELVLVSDDKADLRSWMYRQAQSARPHLDYCDNADGALNADPIAVFMGRAMQRFGCFVRWVSARIVARALPAVDDSG